MKSRRRLDNTTPQEWATADRKIDVILAHDAGESLRSIGRRLGISGGRARYLYLRGLASRVVLWRWLERMEVFNERLRQRAK